MSDYTDYDRLPAVLLDELRAGGIDPVRLHAQICDALDEDLSDGGDVTSTATIRADQMSTGAFAAREEGVVAGLGVAALVFHVVGADAVTITDRVPDGTRVVPGQRVLALAGPSRAILTAERVALNYASHLSGIATATARWVEALSGTRAKVLDTRKTLPGLRQLQKYAVTCGGGVNHRFSLGDMAMVKDNHVVAAGGAVAALEAVRTAYPGLAVEVEVTTLDELRSVLAAGCQRVLLDNMDTPTMSEAVRINSEEYARVAVLEASGGLTLARAREVAQTGVDFISVGALTHSVTVFDLGLDLDEE
jgi:nicotinate-nucleotide pyrophosphorylase (carboxylating)